DQSARSIEPKDCCVKRIVRRSVSSSPAKRIIAEYSSSAGSPARVDSKRNGAYSGAVGMLFHSGGLAPNLWQMHGAPRAVCQTRGASYQVVGDQERSKRSRSITLAHAVTKSWTNFSCASSVAYTSARERNTEFEPKTRS